MKALKLVYKIVLFLAAIATIIFVILYFCNGRNDTFLTVAVTLALIISSLQIVVTIVKEIFTKKQQNKEQDK